MNENNPPETSKAPAAMDGCVEAVRRCVSLVEHIERESRERGESLYSTFGPHLRHCLDHFTCLLRGLDAGEVDYDSRDRDERLERDPGYFREVIEAAGDRLSKLSSADLERPLKVRQAAAPDGRSSVSTSNLERELVFVSGHTIHHVAIMQLLARERGIQVPEEYGVAYSTAEYRRSHGAVPPR